MPPSAFVLGALAGDHPSVSFLVMEGMLDTCVSCWALEGMLDTGGSTAAGGMPSKSSSQTVVAAGAARCGSRGNPRARGGTSSGRVSGEDDCAGTGAWAIVGSVTGCGAAVVGGNGNGAVERRLFRLGGSGDDAANSSSSSCSLMTVYNLDWSDGWDACLLAKPLPVILVRRGGGGGGNTVSPVNEAPGADARLVRAGGGGGSPSSITAGVSPTASAGSDTSSSWRAKLAALPKLGRIIIGLRANEPVRAKLPPGPGTPALLNETPRRIDGRPRCENETLGWARRCRGGGAGS